MAVIAPYSLTKSQSFPASRAAAWMIRTARLWRVRNKQRHALNQLDDPGLRDLAVSRWQLEHELARPFWRD